MLTSLSIQNYALISGLEISFSPGFSVLTGETGAGKSIILGALSLILGQRADSRAIKQGAHKCTIEGIFNISDYRLEDFFSEKDWEYDAQHCIIRREIYESGKSRAFINDVPVSLSDLKELVGRLIDVHSQHQNLLLGDNRFQLQVIDSLSGQPEIFAEYRRNYNAYISLKKQLDNLQQEAAESRTEEDYLRFQLQQLDEAGLTRGEQAVLEQEIETLSHTEEIKAGLFRLIQLLSDDENGVILRLKESLSTCQSLQKIYAPSEEIEKRIQSAYIDLRELLRETGRLEELLEYDPERLQMLNDRLNLIYTLQQKHHMQSVEELIDLRESIREKIQSIDNFDERIAVLQHQTEQAYTEVCLLAEKISSIRKETAGKFEKQLTEKVSLLGMPHMRFSCQIDPKISPDYTGIDTVTFLFSANKNVGPMPMSQIASGGEISRIMLGVKALVAGSMALPTIIFDEIDTGVSGEIADKMGLIMKELGSVMQVITITHLPQIAAQGNVHYHVYKEEKGNTSETHIRELKPEERIKEIASMLSGSELSDAALENARNLLRIQKK